MGKPLRRSNLGENERDMEDYKWRLCKVAAKM